MRHALPVIYKMRNKVDIAYLIANLSLIGLNNL